jgi:ferric-dicitrate binding protein FerR (iron transport regulator)
VRTLSTLLLALLLIGVTTAGGALATAGSSSAFEIRGHLLNVAGVPSWPVLDGDTVTSHDSAVTLNFSDGSRITLAQNSQVRVSSSSRVTVDLLNGSATYSLRESAPPLLMNHGQPVLDRMGTVRVGRTEPSAGGLRPNLSTPKPPPPPITISAR